MSGARPTRSRRSLGRWGQREEEEEEGGGCSDCRSPRLEGERGMDCSHEAKENKKKRGIMDTIKIYSHRQKCDCKVSD